jgi:hypothetical protein
MIKTFEQYLENLTLIRGEGKNQSGNVELFGRGLYLTDDLDVAKFYGDTIKKFEIKGKIYDTTKPFSSSELKKFVVYLDDIFKTNVGSEYLQDVINYNDGKLPKNTDVDYVGISWVLNSNSKFYDILIKNNLSTNTFNSYSNDCTAMNMVLQKMGYVGLKYSTTEIDDLDDIGLGGRNSYVIFDTKSIKKLN